MAAAFGWGILAASSLVIGALVALRFRIGLRVIGLILAFGAGVLISAVAFDLVEEAVSKSHGHGAAIAGLFAGCAVFFGGDWLIDRFGGADRKDADGGQANGSALAIVLGTVLDGVPESMVIGLTIFQGGAVGAAYLTAVFISNLPESISSTSGLRTGGWQKSRILWMWIAIAVISGLASLAGWRTPELPPRTPRLWARRPCFSTTLTSYADAAGSSLHQRGGTPHPEFDPSRRARCVPDRPVNAGNLRSLSGSAIHRLTCVQAG